MQKLRVPGMKNLDKLISLQGSISGTAKASSIASRSSADSITSGSFASLKLTAEKLVKEQASVRFDLDSANSKLKKSIEYINTLEEKLQSAVNENAKLQAKQKEDEKLWQGLESKFSSTKSLCDQVTETLHVLAGQVQDAERDKQLIGEKLSANSAALDRLNDQMKHLSIKLESAEETVRHREKALKELEIEKEEREVLYRDHQCKAAAVVEEKESFIESLEADLAANKLVSENLKCKLDDAQSELKSKEENLSELRASIVSLDKENTDLHDGKHELANRLATSLQEIENLKDKVNALATELARLDEQSLGVSDKIAQLCSLYDSHCKLAELEKDLSAKRAQKNYDKLHHRYLHITSEREELRSVNQKLNDKVFELQQDQESMMVQHVDECSLAEDKIRKLESEVKDILSGKNETEKMVFKLKEKIVTLSENSKSSENEMEDLKLKLSTVESENKQIIERLQAQIHKKEEDIDLLQKEIAKQSQQVDALEKQAINFCNMLEEKEQLILQYTEREKQLEEQRAEIQALLAASESKLGEAKKQYDSLLESKQLELSRHLKEISQKNDQAINDIKKKYEVEKQEIINHEKKKADKIVVEMEKKCEARLEKCNEDSRQHFEKIQEEHSALIRRIQEEHEKKELSLKEAQGQELIHIELEAKNELRERIMVIRSEHEVQIKDLSLQHEEVCRQLQEELDLQKTKEERQKALLQLQWKVMSDNLQEDQEVNSKKGPNTSLPQMCPSVKRKQEVSVSSIRRKQPDCKHQNLHASQKSQAEKKSYLGAQTPVSALVKKMGKVNSEKMMDIPRHDKKVTHHEYEVERSNAEIVAKRRKTRCSVMSGDPRKHKKRGTSKTASMNHPVKLTKGGIYSQHSNNIGDLFTEGSLNPYADDPYAFG